MNTYFVLPAILLPLSVVPLCALSSASWNRASDIYEGLHDYLIYLLNSYTSNAAFDIQDVRGPALAMAQELLNELGRSMKGYKCVVSGPCVC